MIKKKERSPQAPRTGALIRKPISYFVAYVRGPTTRRGSRADLVDYVAARFSTTKF